MEGNLFSILLGFGVSLILPLLIAWIFLRNKKVSPFAMKTILACCGIAAFASIIFLQGNQEDQATINAVFVFLGAFFAYLILAKKYVALALDETPSPSASPSESSPVLDESAGVEPGEPENKENSSQN